MKPNECQIAEEGLFRQKDNIPRALIMEALFLLYAVLILIQMEKSAFIRTLAITFVGIVLEAMPFMLIGSLVGGFIAEFVSEARISAILPKGRFHTVFLAAGMGMIFPVCECAIVPVVRRLVGKGLPLSAAVAFLLGGPIVNPIVLASTTVAYRMNWGPGAIRLVVGYLIAVGVAFGMGFFFRKIPAVLPQGNPANDAESCECCAHDHAVRDPNGSRIIGALSHSAQDFFQIAHFLVIGAFIAATLQTTVDRSAFLFLAERPSLAIIAMMSLAVALNLCSEADAFVAASF